LSRLIEVRAPTAEEHERMGGEAVFVREDADGRRFLIHACRMEGRTYQQWGATTRELGENVGDVTRWARKTA
jgi:hypothetical protein